MNYYVTTSIPYVNGDPHIGFAWELIMGDVLARAARARGDTVIYCTGSDEHGTKVAERHLKCLALKGVRVRFPPRAPHQES